jgi:hypothetical protein
MSKKISVIGRGTAGCITALDMSNSGYEVDWYHDSSLPAASVGEGSDLSFPRFLAENLDLNYDTLDKIDGYYKEGIIKDNWGTQNFTHWFNLGSMSLHFNANKFQNFIFETLKSKVNIVDQNILPQDLKSDYIIDCSGRPQINDEFEVAKYIPVNSAYIRQCSWDYPQFNSTLAIARPYGWVFGIPLKNRCSIGYLFNSDITTLDEINEDWEHILHDYNLNITEYSTPRLLKFSNYYRKQNFTDKVAYNGNASFFLEPMEATSINTIIRNNQLAKGIIKGNFNADVQNISYTNFLKETQDMIMLHYLAGSRWKNEFWDMATSKAQDCFKNTFATYPKSALITNKSLTSYSTWNSNSFQQNLKGLDLYKVLNKLRND